MNVQSTCLQNQLDRSQSAHIAANISWIDSKMRSFTQTREEVFARNNRVISTRQFEIQAIDVAVLTELTDDGPLSSFHCSDCRRPM
jgi:hypothetical protein